MRVLDLTSVVFGAYAAQMLGDLGADVIKVESPAAGDAPPGDVMRWTEGAAGDPALGLAPIFMALNRNKRSALLDLRTEEDAAVVHRLAAGCDVFLSTVRMAGLERLGLDYPSVRALRPNVIYAHGSGYGADGVQAGEPAYDDLIQAASGLADLLPRTGLTDAPRYLPSLVADKVAGLFMAQGVLAALLHRERTGEGQFLEVPMLECLAGFNLVEHQFGHVFDPATGPMGYPRVTTPERRPFPTADGHIALLPYTDAHWRAFFRLAGLEATVGQDARFADMRARAAHVGELYAAVAEVCRTRTTQDWIDRLRASGVPVARVNRLEDLPDDAHLRSVDFLAPLTHPAAGRYATPGHPVRFSRFETGARLHPPPVGAHTEEVRAAAGWPPPDPADLMAVERDQGGDRDA